MLLYLPPAESVTWMRLDPHQGYSYVKYEDKANTQHRQH